MEEKHVGFSKLTNLITLFTVIAAFPVAEASNWSVNSPPEQHTVAGSGSAGCCETTSAEKTLKTCPRREGAEINIIR